MSKKTFVFSFLMLVCITSTFNAFSQGGVANFQKFLSYFQEATLPAIIHSKDVERRKYIDKQLAWEFAWSKNQFQKVEDSWVLPVVFYKLNDKIVIVISASAVEENNDANNYYYILQSYEVKTGKKVAEYSQAMVGLFNIAENTTCTISISQKGEELSFVTEGKYLKKTEWKYQISANGKMKPIK